MQAVKIRTEAKTMTAAQSLTYVKTLLQAGLGCITFLRGLLPEENFIESKLASGEDGNLSFSNTTNSQDPGRKDSKRGNGVTVMTIRRRFTEEADSLLNFLENGIFDALEKHYLRSFIFAIYLDRNDPTNIIEAYTFNFNYHKMEGSNESVPVMTLGDELGKLSLRGNDRAHPALTKPSSKVPSTEEVKRTLQKMVRTLIVATTNMENLPKNRYATFKLFYTEKAPDDYEPPFFRPGDNEKDQWTFGTHDGAEKPEKLTIGKLQTPWHGVNINIASVTNYLPALSNKSSAENTTRHGPNHTQKQEVSARKMEVELLKKDAEKRRVIWAAEPPELRKATAAEEGQRDMQVCASSQFSEQQQQQEGMEMDVAPLGIRNDEGIIVPIPPELLPGKELVFGGVPEKVPSRVGGKLTDEVVPETQTQQLVLSPSSALSNPHHTPTADRRTRGNTTMSLEGAQNASEIPSSSTGEEIDTQLLLKMTISQVDVDPDQQMNVDEAPDAIQTQKTEDSISSMSEDRPGQDDIRSFSRSSAGNGTVKTPASRQIPETRGPEKALEEDNGIQCECGLEVDDAVIFCEGECKRWYHVWCMGYHSASTKNLPAKFICFDCRLHQDANWDLIQHELYPQFIIKYNALSLFRRAIKIVETANPTSLSAFAKATGCDVNVASQLWNRLESDGFIVSDAAELAEINARNKKAKRRLIKRGKKYTFRPAIKKDEIYQDHFTPSPVIEDKLMGLSEMVASRAWCPDGMLGTRGRGGIHSSRASIVQEESQTQEETQIYSLQSETSVGTKRKQTPSPPHFTGKRVKVSLGEEVDLCD